MQSIKSARNVKSDKIDPQGATKSKSFLRKGSSNKSSMIISKPGTKEKPGSNIKQKIS